MKKYPSIVLGVVSACCLFSVHVMASEEPAIEKACKKVTCSKYFTPAYATLVQNTASAWIPSTTTTITVPFTQIQTAKNITFDDITDTFTLPKGIYAFNFQFTMETQSNTVAGELEFRFTDMYLDINNESARIGLDWNMKLNDGGAAASDIGFNSYYWATFSGSRVLSIGADNTVVKMVLVRDTTYSTVDFRFNYDPTLPYPLTTNNNPVRIDIHKIHGCE